MSKPIATPRALARTVDDDGAIVIWKTPYNHDTTKEAERTSLYCEDPSRTQQHFKDQQDINLIIERFTKTGDLPLIPSPLQYADLTTMEDFHSMQNKLAETKALFYRLTPAIRASYNNNAGQWLQDVTERVAAGDLEPLREMGLDLASFDAQMERLTAPEPKPKEDPPPPPPGGGASQTGT